METYTENEICLITGGARGLGKAIAYKLTRKGMHVIINDINKEEADNAAESIVRDGGKASVFLGDVSCWCEVQEMVAAIESSVGPIDILVNNAAVFADSTSFIEIPDEEWDRVIAVNLKGVFNCMKAVGKRMLSRKKGNIVNISSFTGKSGRVVYSTSGEPTKAHYCASKAGIISLTKSLAFELATYGIRVNCVAPGAVRNDTTSPEKMMMINPLVPLGRMGTPEEVAATVSFLVSPEASFITGEILDVNGGILMD